MLTTHEAPEGQVGHESYLWVAPLDTTADLDLQVLAGDDGQPLKLPCKAEGVDYLSTSRLLLVCDEDRSPSKFEGNDGVRFTRRPSQGVFMIVDITGL